MSALPRRLPARGPVKQRWQAHQDRSRLEVMRRAGGRCEAEDCPNEAEEWAHLFSRRHIIGEPWASSASLTMGLCGSHHRAIDRGLDPDLRDRLRLVALVRLCAEYSAPLWLLDVDDLLGSVRAVEDWLTHQVEPPL